MMRRFATARASILLVACLLFCLSVTEAHIHNANGSAPSSPFSRNRRIKHFPPRNHVLPTFDDSNLQALLLRGGGSPVEASSASTTTTRNSLVQAFSVVSESKTACWIILISSILLEGVATGLSKNARDRASALLLLGALSLYILCMLGFFVALAKIEVGIAYACWSALGTLIVSTAGILFFGESADRAKLLCLSMITAGVVGLNLLE